MGNGNDEDDPCEETATGLCIPLHCSKPTTLFNQPLQFSFSSMVSAMADLFYYNLQNKFGKLLSKHFHFSAFET